MRARRTQAAGHGSAPKLPASIEEHRRSLYLGAIQELARQCFKCKATWTGHEEKETDVNIAVQLVEDAIDGIMNIAYVFSADSGQSPVIRLIQRRFSNIEYVPIAPPKRPRASELLQLSKRNIKIIEIALERNRLPETITDGTGTFACPSEYVCPTKT